MSGFMETVLQNLTPITDISPWFHYSLRPIYTVRLCHKRQAYDRPTTWIISCKSNLQLAYDCRVGPKSRRRPVESLLYAVKSNRVNQPLLFDTEMKTALDYLKEVKATVRTKWLVQEHKIFYCLTSWSDSSLSFGLLCSSRTSLLFFSRSSWS